MTLALRYAARSHLGLIRKGNEDSVYAGPRILAVADGMGGHAAGEVASAVAIAAIAPLDEDAPGSDLLDLLRERAVAANEHLRDMVAGDATLDGMGTTLTAFLFSGTRLGMVHIGDSRAYLLRDGALRQITTDHTLVQKLVDEGRISPEEASTHPQRNLVTRALDGREDIEPDLSVREVRAGDRYLLCSDGLTGPVGQLSTLQEALEGDDVQASCDKLVQLALRGGGPDNVTVIVADVVESTGPRQGSPVIAGAAAEAPQPPPEGVAESSAARARTAEGRDVEPPTTATAVSAQASPKNRKRGLVAGLLTVSLLVVVAGAAFLYVRSLYFVGVDGDDVAVYRGVSGSLAGLSLSGVARGTDLPIDRLDEVALRRVENGIPAADLPDALRIVGNLTEQAADNCPALPSPAPSGAAPSAAASSQPSAVPPGVPAAAGVSAAPSPAPSSPASDGVPAGCPS